MIEFIKTKRTYLAALAILFVFVSLSDTTYSLFLNTNTTEEVNYKTGLLDLKFTEDEKMNMEDLFPTNDSVAINNKPYILTIKNTGSLIYLFDLKMISSTNQNEESIDYKYIKVKVDNDLPHNLLSTNNIISSNNIIYPGEEIKFKINTWLDADTPNKELGKTFTAKIVTSGTAIYKTLDSSGANHPKLTNKMIPVYYDEYAKLWRIANKTNTSENGKWYDYDNKMWANSITVKNSDKQIYDITRTNDLKIDNLLINNGNVITDNNYLDLKLSSFNSNALTNVIRVKFNNLKGNKIYLVSNDKYTYYYDNSDKKFIFKIGNNTVSSKTYDIEKNKWYIISYSYDGAKATFYIDGDKLGEENISGNISNFNLLRLGANSNGTDKSSLTIGNVLIYNRILKDSEISRNYKSSVSIIYDGLVSGYDEFTPMTLEEYYLSRPIGTNINNNDIDSQFVWIPRYKYRVWNVTGEKNIDSYEALEKGIDIVFENNLNTSGVIYCKDSECYSDKTAVTKVSSADNGKYYTHPSFTTSVKELPGFWVSKYEISTDSNKCNKENTEECTSADLPLTSKNNNYAWRNNYLSNYYQTVSKNNYHIIKNIEWASIAYLSHSKYGLCNTDKCEEIENNNTYISGNNPKDSTTGNIYGVYDMAGSGVEFTMGNYTGNSNNINLNETFFKDYPISNDDFDLYKEGSFILGDATKELSLDNGIWYNNNASFVNSSNNWFIRGGNIDNTYKGIFSYSGANDIKNNNITTRFVSR